ncbi:MAG: AtpZ/AtpI family protein [Hyphomonadaceae bacterium]|nr:AtpZ/AtpI family protein [Hyphomonadaceae bacterium]
MADTDPPPGGAPNDTDALRARVEQARAAHARKLAPRQDTSAASLAMRFGGEFGAAVLVGAGAGYGVDYWLHTNPWGLVIGLTAGFAAGVVNVVRVARSYASANPVDPKAPSVPDDADD